MPEPKIRVEFIGGFEAYGIPKSLAGREAWDLKIKWRLEGLPTDPEKLKELNPLTWTPPDCNQVTVVGWLFQHVTSWYRRADANTWLPDSSETEPSDYWEMWWVVPLSDGYAAVPYKNLGGAAQTDPPSSAVAHCWNDAYQMGTTDLETLSQKNDGADIIYRKIGRVSYLSTATKENVKTVEAWLQQAPRGGVGAAGFLHSSKMGPQPEPLHGLQRVHAIRYKPSEQQVERWKGLKTPSQEYYSNKIIAFTEAAMSPRPQTTPIQGTVTRFDE